MEAPILETSRLAWPDESACAETAARIAAATLRHTETHDAFIELHGPLGAGKTTFARHLLHALGVEGTIKSPTYTLMEPYRADAIPGGLSVSHFDFYRFDVPREWEDAGFREVFAAPGLKVCEWPEKAQGLLPRADLRVTIVPRDDPHPALHPGPQPQAGEGGAAAERRDVRIDALTATGLLLLP